MDISAKIYFQKKAHYLRTDEINVLPGMKKKLKLLLLDVLYAGLDSARHRRHGASVPQNNRKHLAKARICKRLRSPGIDYEFGLRLIGLRMAH
jgi:hypothetical protein